MFYDQNQSRIIMSYPGLLAAYPGAGDLSTESARNALGLYLVREAPPSYAPRTHTLSLDGVELVEGAYHARYTLAPLPADLVLRFNAERLRFYAKLTTFSTFGRGWVNRVAGNLDHAAADN